MDRFFFGTEWIIAGESAAAVRLYLSGFPGSFMGPVRWSGVLSPGRGPMKSLPERADFIGQAHNHGFARAGKCPKGERPHMCADNPGFKRIDIEVTDGVVHGGLWVPEAVQLMLMIMPVIQVIVMQESAADKRGLICPDMQETGETETHAGHAHTVVVCRNTAVLPVGLHNLNPRVIGGVPDKLVKTRKFFRVQCVCLKKVIGMVSKDPAGGLEALLGECRTG